MELIEFLIKEEAFSKYIRNILDRAATAYTGSYITTGDISGAFNWVNTPEADDYWSDLYLKFNEKAIQEHQKHKKHKKHTL